MAPLVHKRCTNEVQFQSKMADHNNATKEITTLPPRLSIEARKLYQSSYRQALASIIANDATSYPLIASIYMLDTEALVTTVICRRKETLQHIVSAMTECIVG